MPDPEAISLDELLVHTSWVRALARSLVRDDGTAEDLVQDTWMRALRRPPRTRDNLRGWLATVVKNAARERGRRGAHRANREAESSRAEASVPTPDDLLGKLEAQRTLAEEITKLPETLRTVLLLHYYEKLGTDEIARRTRTPAGTVRWRLGEARAELKVRLDARSGGDRSVWVHALTPWLAEPLGAPLPRVSEAGPSTASTAATTPSSALARALLAMSLPAKIALVLVPTIAVLVGSGWLQGLIESSTVVTVDEAAPGTPDPLAEATSEVDARRAVVDPRDDEVAQAAAATSRSDLARPVTASVKLRAVDEAGEPLEGITVTSGRWRVTTDAAGRARRDVEAVGRIGVVTTFQLVSAEHALTEATVTSLVPGDERDLGDLVMRPGGGVSGIVRDATGRPLAGAAMGWRPDRNPQAGLRRLTSSLPDEVESQTDADGRFEIWGLPVGPGKVQAEAEGRITAISSTVDIAAGTIHGDIELVLEDWPSQETIRGRVTGPAGEPVAYTSVQLVSRSFFGSQSIGEATDAEGNFATLVNAKRKYSITVQPPSEHPDWAVLHVKDVRGGDFVELQFAAAPKLRLDVVDERGTRIADFVVTIRPLDDAIPATEHRFLSETEIVEVPAASERFMVEVRAELHAPEELGPIDGESLPSELHCVLRGVPGLVGSVARSDGKPAVDAKLELKRIATSAVNQDGFPVFVEADPIMGGVVTAAGHFALSPEERGEYALYVKAPGHARLELAPFAFEPEQGLDVGELKLALGGTLEGRVIVGLGANPAGTIVGISRGDGYARTQRVGADGGFRFEQLTPGPWWLGEHAHEIGPEHGSYSTSGGRRHGTVPSNVVVSDLATTRMDLDLARDATIRLTVSVTLEGRSLAGETARLLPDQDLPLFVTAMNDGHAVRLDEEGRGEFGLERAGSYHVVIESGEDDPWVLMDSVELTAGVESWFFEAQTGRAELTGLPPAVEGETWLLVWRSGSRVALRPITPDEQGSCTVPTALAGELGITVLSGMAMFDDPEDWPAVRTFELGAGKSVAVDLRD